MSAASFHQPPNTLPLDKLLPKMIATVAQMLGVDSCILQGFEASELVNTCIIYQKIAQNKTKTAEILRQTVWETRTLTVMFQVNELELTTHQQQHRWQFYQQASIAATFLLPLLLQQELLAVLALHRYHFPYQWSDQEIQLASMVADQVVLAISQARAYETVHALAQREVLINTITAAIRSSLESEAIFKAITHQLGQALTVDGCALSLWTQTDEYVQCVGLYDRSHADDHLPQSFVPIAQNPVLQQLLKTAKPVVLEDMVVHQDMNQFDLPLRLPARALLIVPLIVDGEIIGSISLRQTNVARQWTQAEIELTQAVASQAAIAVQQARLYDTSKQQAEKLRKSEQRVKQLNQYLTESVLKRFLPAAIVNKVAAGELVLDLSPEPRLVTILFSDIVGFTPLSNELGSRQVATLLNEYLETMTQAVFEHGGTVDKFIGDAIFSLFGAPEVLFPKEQVQRAVAVARTMHRYLKGLNHRWQEKGLVGENGPPLVQFRCGIHQGSAVVGMFGGGQRLDYTAIGPAVNIASRLQEVAEANTILVSKAVAFYLDKQEIIQVKSFKLKGINEEILAFSIAIQK